MRPGDPIPPLERTIEQPDMVAYAGATWDWHRLHYDPSYAMTMGFPKPVVDGQLFGALLAEQLLDWLGPRAFITNLGFRFRAPVTAGETVRCEGEITEMADGHVRLAQRVVVRDLVAVEGTATVRLP